MRVYGLTGGMGCGKSEVARVFRERGVPVIDADRLGHEAIAPGGEAERAVREAFGEDIVTEGAIDRRKLGPLVFGDDGARARLNALVHPIIRKRIKERCRELRDQGHKAVVIDAALLAEDGVAPACLTGLILVSASEETRIERLMASRGLSRDEVARRLAAQTPPERKRPLASQVIDNEDTLEALRARAREMADHMLKEAS
ncbi:MAG: dephospho-CoA kinase [Candidatus Hydrogenedentota bacterium]